MTSSGKSDASNSAKNSEQLPPDFEAQSKRRYEKLESPEVDFQSYLRNEGAELLRQRALRQNPALAYVPSLDKMTPCGGGSFDDPSIQLDVTEWQGAFGSLPLASTNPFASFTSGIVGGPIGLGGSHQTWVGTGLDPVLAALTPSVSMPTSAQGSLGAVRIGNAVSGCGCELLSKTFAVTPLVSTITFWYAIVLQNPDPTTHAVSRQPYFWVRVTDASGNIVPGAFDFGNGSDKLIADTTNPLFMAVGPANDPIVYKDWSCAQIDLTTQVGKQVTVEFVTADCGHCGHWGYAYVDNFCGNCKGSPSGDITYDCEGSSHCGPGKICFDYDLPRATDANGNSITGDVKIGLDILQNGVILTSLGSPLLTSGSSYCFNITPASILGIDLSLGGFDFAATGYFSITANGVTTNLGQIKAGTAPDGVSPGQNNDYQIACRSCGDIKSDQDEHLSKECSKKVNHLRKISCHCPDDAAGKSGCGCGGKGGSDGHDDHDQAGHDDCGCGCGGKNKSDGHHDDDKDGHDDYECGCKPVRMPKIEPCISVAWGDSKCDCMETDDVEVMCITICNCYSNVTFSDLSIGQIRITDMAGKPVPTLPDGTPSVQVFPSGPICFGDIGPCSEKGGKSCVSRELVVYTRGAIGKDYKLSFEGVCFAVKHHFQTEQCFVLTLCKDE
jgi:hypothetical protein